MLEALKETPPGMCAELTWTERFDCMCCALSLLSFDFLVVKTVQYVCAHHLHYTAYQFIVSVAMLSVLLTLLLYAYFVYVVDYVVSKRLKKEQRRAAESEQQKRSSGKVLAPTSVHTPGTKNPKQSSGDAKSKKQRN